MKLSLASTSLFIAAAKYVHADVHCENDSSFHLEGFPSNTCSWIEESKVKNDVFCKHSIVKERCPKLCGACEEAHSERQISPSVSTRGKGSGSSPSKGSSPSVPSKGSSGRPSKGSSPSVPSKGSGSSPSKGSTPSAPSSLDPTGGKGKGKGSHPVTSAPTLGSGTDPETLNPTRTPATTSPTPIDCVDDPNFVSPLPFPYHNCAGFASLDCFDFSCKFKPEIYDNLLKSCPLACKVCSVPTTAPTVGDNAGPDTLRPTPSPTDCFDSRSYVLPYDNTKTCNDVGPDCNSIRSNFSRQSDFEELLRECPKACNVSCDATAAPTIRVTSSPTSSPSIRPTTSPSLKPSVSQAPTDCFDNRAYVLPYDSSKTCNDVGPDCNTIRRNFSSQSEFEELLRSCPKACNVSCGAVASPTASPTSSPSSIPSIGTTSSPTISPSMGPTSMPSDRPSLSPRNCRDDESYENPVQFLLPGNGCEAFIGQNCFDLSFLQDEVLETLLSSCPRTCGLCSPLNTESPSTSPSLSPSQSFETRCDWYGICNIVIGNEIFARSTTERSNLEGPIDGDETTRFGLDGSTFESTTDYIEQWWEVDLRGVYEIVQFRVIACAGDQCNPDGLKLENIKISIYGTDGLIDLSKDEDLLVASYHYTDSGSEINTLIPGGIQCTKFRVTKLDKGITLSLNEVQLFGKAISVGT